MEGAGAQRGGRRRQGAEQTRRRVDGSAEVDGTQGPRLAVWFGWLGRGRGWAANVLQHK
jgi:hypothetical protein